MSIFKAPNINNMFAVNTEGGELDSGVIGVLSGGRDKYVSAREAIQNSDLYSLITQISGDLASARLIADRKNVQGFLNNPDPRTSPHSFWQSFYAQLLLNGEAFAYRWRNRNGQDEWWEQLRPSQVVVYISDDGKELFYQVSFDEPMLETQIFSQKDVIHVRLMGLNGGLRGISPLTSLVNEFHVKTESDKLTLKALKQSITSNGVLKINKGGLMTWQQKASRSRQFMKQYTSSDAGPVVIDDLEEYSPLEMKSDVAQLLSQVDWTATQFAKAYGVPDSYLNGSGDQQSSLDQIKGLYANSINRYMNASISELNRQLPGKIHSDLRPALDPLGEHYMQRMSALVKEGSIGQNQFEFLMRQQGYLPEDMPEAVIVKQKGGDKSEGNQH